jgi:hypothetical protein
MSNTKSEIETLGKIACAIAMTNGDAMKQAQADRVSEGTRRLAAPENMLGPGARTAGPGLVRGGALVMPQFS